MSRLDCEDGIDEARWERLMAAKKKAKPVAIGFEVRILVSGGQLAMAAFVDLSEVKAFLGRHMNGLGRFVVVDLATGREVIP